MLHLARTRPLSKAIAAALVAGTLLCIAEPATSQEARPEIQESLVDALIVKYRQASLESRSGAASAASERAPVEAARLSALGVVASAAGFELRALRRTSFEATVVGIGRSVSRQAAQGLAQALRDADADIEYAVPDRIIPLALLPNDPGFPNQWPLGADVAGIRATVGYDRIGVRSISDPLRPFVAIVDTGYRPHVDMGAPAFGPNYVEDGPPMDTGDFRSAGQCPNLPGENPRASWHGTKLQSVVSATVNNGVGLSGVAGAVVGVWQARWWGPCGGTLSTYADAINAAVQFRSIYGQRVRVMVLAQGGVDSPCDPPMEQAISNAIASGVVVVAAAGNGARVDGQNVGIDVSRSAPASCPGVIAVAATDRYGAKTVYSNFGAGITVAAPGGDKELSSPTSNQIYLASHQPTGVDASGTISSYYDWDAGTSFAAPHVAAVAALVINQAASLTVSQVRDILVQTARPFPNSCDGCGAGIVDVAAAIDRATRRERIGPPLCQGRWSPCL